MNKIILVCSGSVSMILDQEMAVIMADLTGGNGPGS